ncbi:MAG: hypothetical protein A2498_06885 [Lentisphaerae bacterium RIFOXYC12_FULL_60_16]|nr:MAG: hypothetical protein A2498_06885 [Lentisphaerae bacterium RIFOXYC12_FULL_60_16]OGV85929.1 MAG: hypothetical protein A2340_09865 [Lentisphaerae bacterium RIFOXYB12_FULL_60_10]
MRPLFDRHGPILNPTDLDYDGWLDLLLEAGMNVLGLHTDYPTLKAWMQSRDGEAWCNRLAKARIDLEFAIHFTPSFLSEGLFRKHPDWFPVDICGTRYWEGANPCTSSEALLDYFREKASESARTLPSTTHRYHLWAADNRPWCNCKACAPFSPSENNLRLMHVMLEGLRSVDPKAELSYLAYLESLPQPVKVKPAKGIYLEFAPYRRNHRMPLADPGCRANADQMTALRGLLTVFPAAQARVLDYWLDISLFSAYRKDRPPVEVIPAPGIVKSDAETYAALGIREVTTFACWMNTAYFRSYPQARNRFVRFSRATRK